MLYHRTWRAVNRSMSIGRYFRHADAPGVADALDRPDSEFDPWTAWWLVEINRFAYRQCVGEARWRAAALPPPDVLLERAGLRMLGEVESAMAGALVLETLDGPYARIVAFRGNCSMLAWLAALDQRPADLPEGGRACSGFLRQLDSVWPRLEPYLRGARGPLVYTGHSAGGAFVQLAADRHEPSVGYTFGAPRVADAAFAARVADVPVWRVVNGYDVFVRLPAAPWRLFRHAGRAVYVTAKGRLLIDPPRVPHSTSAALLRTLADAARVPVWQAPPRPIADHADVNYRAALERAAVQMNRPSAARRPAYEIR